MTVDPIVDVDRVTVRYRAFEDRQVSLRDRVARRQLRRPARIVEALHEELSRTRKEMVEQVEQVHRSHRREIVLRSGTTARQVMSLNTFMHTWNRSDRWAFVALPPGKLAVSADEQATQDATLAFARLATTANARSAYYAALQRWPDNLPLAIGLGNAAYESGDLDGARQAFEAASKTHPEDGAILNNLAFILAKQGHIAAARRTARQALALGDRWRQEAQKTLDQIESMTNAPGKGPKPKKQP